MNITEHNSNLDDDLLQTNSQHQEDHRDSVELIQSDSETPMINLRSVREDLHYSIPFNTLTLLVYLGKISASSFVLYSTTDSCMDKKTWWVIMMLIHDFVELILVTLTIRLVLKVNRTIHLNQQAHDDGARDDIRLNEIDITRDHSVNENEMDKDLEFDAPRSLPSARRNRETEMIFLAREVARIKKTLDSFSKINTMFYFFLFLFGQRLFYFGANKGCGSIPMIRNIILAYLLLGYVWMFWPVMLGMLLCLCCPCLPCIFYVVNLLMGREKPQAANKNVIKNLPVRDFSSNLAGTHECAVCILEYKEGDKIIELPCNPMHHFHESCIKRWLEVNGVCPMCRKKVG